MLAPYRRVLSVPGAWQFSLTGFVARLPISMVSLGIVLLVSTETGSYALAGTVASAYLLGNALLAVVVARLVDRLGQHAVLPVAQSLHAVVLALLVWGVEAGWPSSVLHALAALSGGALPQIGACVRARWSHVLDEPGSVQTAYALEAVVDEALFVLGPTAVTFLATSWHPVAGLLTATACGLAGAFALAGQRRTEPPAGRQPHLGPVARPPMPWSVVGPLTVVCAALGAVFGATEIVTVAFTEERGVKALAGPVLGLWALGSLTAGLLSGAVAWRSGPEVRLRWGVLLLGLALLPLTLVDSVWLLAVLMLVGGIVIAPTLIATMALTERSVPRVRLTEGMAVLHMGMGIGIAPGAALAGVVVDAHGASAAYVVPALAGLLGAVAAWLARRPAPAPHGAAVRT